MRHMYNTLYLTGIEMGRSSDNNFDRFCILQKHNNIQKNKIFIELMIFDPLRGRGFGPENFDKYNFEIIVDQ